VESAQVAAEDKYFVGFEFSYPWGRYSFLVHRKLMGRQT
jgi:hypothetical protein